MKTVFDVQNYNYEVTVINGNDIERFYLADDKIVSSEVLYKGETKEDALNNFMKYWTSPKFWYIANNTLQYV